MMTMMMMMNEYSKKQHSEQLGRLIYKDSYVKPRKNIAKMIMAYDNLMINTSAVPVWESHWNPSHMICCLYLET